MRAESPDEDLELSDEADEARQAQRGQCRHHPRQSYVRHPLYQPAQLTDGPSVGPVVHQPHQQEEATGDDTMGEEHEHRPVERLRGQP